MFLHSIITFTICILLIHRQQFVEATTSLSTTFSKVVGTSGATTVFWRARTLSTGEIVIVGYSDGSIGSASNNGNTNFLVQLYTSTGTLSWTKIVTTTGSTSKAIDVVVDSSDQIYVGGYSDGSFNSQTNQGGYDFVYVVYDSSGNEISSAQIGGTSNDYIDGVGIYHNVVVFGGQVLSSSFNGVTGPSGATAYAGWLTYDPSGPTTSVGYISTSNDYTFINGVDFDSSGNLLLVGRTQATTFQGTATTGGSNIFVVKTDTAGSSIAWSVLFASTNWESGDAIAVDTSGNSYIIGYTYGSSITHSSDTNNGGGDIVFAKVSSTGSVTFAYLIGGSSNDYGHAIAVDSTTGLVYLGGKTASPTFYSFSTGGYREASFVSVYTTSGVHQVTYILSTYGVVRGLYVDSASNLYVAGGSYHTMGSTSITGSEDGFLYVMAPDGYPTEPPTAAPVPNPTEAPTPAPTHVPSSRPSSQPSNVPSRQPSGKPSGAPSTSPSSVPTTMPTSAPSYKAESWGQVTWDKRRHRHGGLCENHCSNHGTCENNNNCKCFTGLDGEPEWTGPDCSLRTCPKDFAWVGEVVNANDLHPWVECSNKGLCDRASGT